MYMYINVDIILDMFIFRKTTGNGEYFLFKCVFIYLIYFLPFLPLIGPGTKRKKKKKKKKKRGLMKAAWEMFKTILFIQTWKHLNFKTAQI